MSAVTARCSCSGPHDDELGQRRGVSFFAVDPLAVRATIRTLRRSVRAARRSPPATRRARGFSSPIRGTRADADAGQPPPLPAGYDQFKIAAGMTRAEVARRRGYPQGYSTAAALNVMPVWYYYDGPGDAYTVTFREGRVAAFTVRSDCLGTHDAVVRTAGRSPRRRSQTSRRTSAVCGRTSVSWRKGVSHRVRALRRGAFAGVFARFLPLFVGSR